MWRLLGVDERKRRPRRTIQDRRSPIGWSSETPENSSAQAAKECFNRIDREQPVTSNRTAPTARGKRKSIGLSPRMREALFLGASDGLSIDTRPCCMTAINWTRRSEACSSSATVRLTRVAPRSAIGCGFNRSTQQFDRRVAPIKQLADLLERFAQMAADRPTGSRGCTTRGASESISRAFLAPVEWLMGKDEGK